ncbi:MAG: O-antigen ligase family protein, partial [Elusimicrobia bacterium]|nr:O-antigen ligase family protein [Elusimicrobiota bacterium]
MLESDRGTILTGAVLALAATLPVSIAGVNCLAVALTALLLWMNSSGDRLPWRAVATPFSAWLLAYFCVAIVVSAAGVDPATSWPMLHKDLHKLWLTALLLAALPLADRKRLWPALGTGFTLIAAAGIAQTLLLRMPDGTMIRAHAFVHPVTYGEILSLGFLGAACLRGLGEKAPPKKALDAFLVLSGAALFLNQTRGALLGLFVGLLALACGDKRLRRLALFAVAGLPLVLALWELLPNNHTIAQMVIRSREPGPNGALARLILWRVGWDIFRSHPWLGAGPGNYRTLFTHYFQGVLDGQRVWGSAHNLYIHQAAERGLLGLAALGGLLATMTWRAWRRVQSAATPL